MAAIIAKSVIPGYPHWCIRRMGLILACCLPAGKAGKLQIQSLSAWGIAEGLN